MTDTYPLSAWSLADLFPSHDGPEMQAAFARLEDQARTLEELRPRLSPEMGAEEFLALLDRLEEIRRLMARIRAYAGLWFTSDTQDQAAVNFQAQVDQRLAELNNRTLFFSLWWKDLDDANAQRLMDSAGDRRYFLEEMRLFKPHTLSEPEEKIINLKDVTGAAALNTLYSALTNRYIFRLEVDGEVKELTRGELGMYFYSPDPNLRAAAYQEALRVFTADSPILGQIYQALVRDWHNEQVGLRKFPAPIAARNLANSIPDEAVEALLEVCERNAALFQRYFQVKARYLGVDKIRRYDIYAPISSSDKTYPYDQATRMVLDSFAGFDPRLANLARRVFEQNHLDSEVRKGKQSGAFCWTATPDLTPWVQLSYQGRADDVYTLAHELGHAIHSLLAEHHSAFTQHASLPLAETASTFGEMMVVDRLLAEEPDQAVRREILFQQMDGAYMTIMRQAYFALFERQAHGMIQQGAGLTELSAAYLDNLKRQFGDSLELSEDYRWEWVSIPHIYQTPFYVYAYSFGQLLVFSLYQQYKQEGESFKPRYFDILRAGGSDAPERILQRAGIDLRSAAFWQGGFDVVGALLARLEDMPIK